MSAPLQPAAVTVPASSANLGPAFDCAGLALELRDRLRAVPRADGRVQVRVTGEGADAVATDERNLVASAVRLGLAELGHAGAGFDLECHNEIPHARGLGSSAAAIVGGLALARGMAGSMTDAELLRLAGRMETHADNIAAALLGGFTLGWMEPVAQAVRVPVHPDLHAVVAISAEGLATKATRAALPGAVPLADAAFTAGRAALLGPALAQPTPELLLAATEDRLHQGARRSMYPQSYELMAALRALGLAAAISGAGPSVLVLVPGDAREALQEAESRAPAGWQVRALPIATHGVQG